jgi:hypothetical protein
VTQDPVSVFAYALALVLIFNVMPIPRWGPIVPLVITLYWRKSAPNLALSRVAASSGVGIIEQILYIYCLSSTHREFIGSVLLFKAFFNWLNLVPPTATKEAGPTAADSGKPQSQLNDAAERHRLYLLEVFYTYAIGNFLSLAFAIFFYEIVHLWLIRITPFPVLLPFLHL